MDKRISNLDQKISVTDLVINSGKARGKRCILVHAGCLEAMFSVDNALDVVYVRYKGVNISFLSKNGLNNKDGDFAKRFEGGFLYTCGMDGISTCNPDCPLHGSLHLLPCEEVTYTRDTEGVNLRGVISDTALFGKNLRLERNYRITEQGIEICDTVENLGYTPCEYVMLYHMNFGYPFLSEALKVTPCEESISARTDIAKARIAEAKIITPPLDANPEDCYHLTMKEGKVDLYNTELSMGCQITYPTDTFPLTLIWKSMASGDYALGVEPATTSFYDYKTRTLAPSEKAVLRVNANFY